MAATFGKRNAKPAPGVRTPVPLAAPARKLPPLATFALAFTGIMIGGSTVLGLGISLLLPDSPPPAEPAVVAEADLPSHWVVTQRLARHTCASKGCGVVGEFYFRQGVDILEERNGYARVSKFYDASCENGVSIFVDSGPAACTATNGIENGMFAEWVEASALSAERPSDPSEGATGWAAVVAGSDDYNLYHPIFAQTAEKLVGQGSCTAEDIRESGGFWASVNLRPRAAYFTYCSRQKYYVDVKTGEIWRG